MAGQGAAPARLDRGADAERRTGGGGDQPRRAGPPLRADPAAGDARHAAGQAALLADLRGGRKHGLPVGIHAGSPPIAIRSRRWAGRPITPRTTPRRHRRFRRRCPVAGLRGRVHEVPGTEGRAAGIRLHLAAGASLAADQILARAADGGAVGGPRAHRHRAIQRAAHHSRRATGRRPPRCSSG